LEKKEFYIPKNGQQVSPKRWSSAVRHDKQTVAEEQVLHGALQGLHTPLSLTY